MSAAARKAARKLAESTKGGGSLRVTTGDGRVVLAAENGKFVDPGKPEKERAMEAATQSENAGRKKAPASETTRAQTVSGARLRSFIERIERLEEEKATIAGDIKEIYAEAKGEGFDTPTIRQCVRERKKDRAKRDEQLSMFDLYWDALGER